MTESADARLRAYFDQKNVIGCQSPPQATLISFFLRQLEALGIKQDLMEIGVHRGRSAMLIAQALPVGRKLHLVDWRLEGAVLDEAMANITGLNPTLGADDMIADCRYSTALHTDYALKARGAYSFIHIDGGHAATDVFQDLVLADQLLCEQGIVVCDDFCAEGRPGVTEAVYRYLNENPYSFKLVLTGWNKAVLVRTAALGFWWTETVAGIVDFMEANWRPVQLHSYQSPIVNPTLALVPRTGDSPPFAGFFWLEDSARLAAALQAAGARTSKPDD